MKLPARISTFLLTVFCLTLSANVAAQTKAWGYNGSGELGIGNYINAPIPQTVTAMPDATNISSGLYHTLFLKADGSVHIAGVDVYGTLGNGGTQGEALTPMPVAGMTNALQVASNGYHSMVLKADGTVWAWGSNSYGQIGMGTFSPATCFCVNSPRQSLISNVIQIDASYVTSMALKADGTVWTWGTDSGDGTNGYVSSVPVQKGAANADFNNIISISGGDSHGLALKSDGTVWAWGWNSRGQLGDGSSDNHRNRVERVSGLSGVTQIAAGEEHSVALKPDGTVWVWGRNDRGQIGNGTMNSAGCLCVPLPTQANISDVVDIKAEGDFTLARKRDGTVWAWGSNFYGQTGSGGTANSQSVPAQSMVGDGNALVGAGLNSSFSSIPSFTTPTGSLVRHYGENVNLYFFGVTNAGTTGYSAIDPTATGLSVPAGYTIQPNAQAYNISTTAAFAKSVVCVKATSEYDPAQFALLKLLHAENGTLVDRTIYSSFRKRQLCGQVNSLSPFVVAKGLTPTPSGLSVSGRILNANNRGAARAIVTLTGQDGNTRFAHANPFGYYRFQNVAGSEIYTLRVISKQHQFAPQTITIVENISNLNFTPQQ
ncbi:MAG TPA: hypothetical protein VF721_19460 [Pyrinomonadaceae bacterium]